MIIVHVVPFDIHKMAIPFLAIQPNDDFIQGGELKLNTPTEIYTASEHVIYMETEHGNHLGFYEGGLFDAFTNKTSYTYPARVAVTFFETIVSFEQSCD